MFNKNYLILILFLLTPWLYIGPGNSRLLVSAAITVIFLIHNPIKLSKLTDNIGLLSFLISFMFIIGWFIMRDSELTLHSNF